MQTFNDIFKSSFLEKVTAISMTDIILSLVLAFVLGLFIMAVYRKTFKGVLYSDSFAVTLLAMTMITTVIIIAITSNVVLSLGMVGALSIVRFRSAVKEPIDIAFIFWAISVGIITGAGLITLAIVGSIIIGLIMVLFINKKSFDNPYILVINCQNDGAEEAVMAQLKAVVKRHVIKSKTVSSGNGIELTIEIRLKEMQTQFVNELSKLEGVENAVLVSYNGDYMN